MVDHPHEHMIPTRTSQCILNSHSSSNASGKILSRRCFSARDPHHRTFKKLGESDSHARTKSTCSDTTEANVVVMNICRPITPSPHHYNASSISTQVNSSAGLGSYVCSHNDSATSFPAEKSQLQMSTPRSDIEHIQHIFPLHTSPQMKPQREFLVSEVNSLSLTPSHHKSSLGTDCSLTPTLVQGRSIGSHRDATPHSVDPSLCKLPVVQSHETTDRCGEKSLSNVHLLSDSSEITINGKSLMHGCSQSSAECSFISTTTGNVGASAKGSNQLFGSYSIVNRPAFCPSKPSLTVVSLLNVELRSDRSTIALPDDENRVAQRKSVSKRDSNSRKSSTASSCSPATSMLLVTGKTQSAPLPVDSENAYSPAHFSDSVADSPEGTCNWQNLPSSPIVPLPTPRNDATAVVTSLAFKSSVEWNSESVNLDRPSNLKDAVVAEEFVNSQTHSRNITSRSKLLRQSQNCLHPTLMSSDENHCAGAKFAAGVPPDLKVNGVTSLPWFVNDSSSKSFVHALQGTCYVDRQSGINVSSMKATLQDVPFKERSSKSANEQLLVRLYAPQIADAPMSGNMNNDVVVNSSDSILPSQSQPHSTCETNFLQASASDPNHLLFLASSRIRRSLDGDAQLRKDGSSQQMSHHHAGLIIPKPQGLLSRLDRDCAKFTQYTLPLHVKGQKRNERRHQRVILGADPLRAQKLDL